MSTNPLFTDYSEEKDKQAAVRLVRAKVARAYGEEPDALQEIAEAVADKTPSKHQIYMRELSASGKSLAEIQTASHEYYPRLNDADKRDVWQEFYAVNQHTPYQKLFQKQQPVASRKQLAPNPQALSLPAPDAAPRTSQSGVTVSSYELPASPKARSRTREKLAKVVRDNQTLASFNATPAGATTRRVTAKVHKTVSANGRLHMKQHIQSLLFGLGMGTLVLVVLLFSFFNEFVIAPFIQPSRSVDATPIIVTDAAATQTAQPTVIVPKINIQIPIDFDLTSTDEATVQASLESGVVHYPSTVLPGQNGNGAYFGHSSSNIFNNGKYKFAFVLLHQLTTGDVFYVTYNGKVYAYQVFAKEIVPPTQISVLTDTKGKQATAVLITCDPPGLSTNRLVVWGEQISPTVSSNTEATPRSDSTPDAISSNGPTLWTRIWRALDGNTEN
jgi:LPXTG-site transpeptidase (sortase) family protein